MSTSDEEAIRHAKMEAIEKAIQEGEDEAKDLEGKIILKSGDTIEANIDTAEAIESEYEFEGKTKKQIRFKFKDKSGNDKHINLSRQWAGSLFRALRNHNGKGRVKITRTGEGLETKYIITDITVTPANEAG